MTNQMMEAQCDWQAELVEEILETADVRTVFQPILSLRDGSVLGYEALSRGPEGSELESPERLFAAAGRCGRLWELELLCRTKALKTFQRFELDTKLFLNVNPSIMEDPKFQQGFTREYLLRYKIDPRNIIFEITEKSAVSSMEDFKKAIDSYRGQDYKIAIDDAGAGYSGLNLITDICPHYLKLDMKLIRDIDRDDGKRALVKGLAEFTRITGTCLIAEGIETEHELQTLIEIGVHYGQGYLLRRPNPVPGQASSDLISLIVDYNARKNHIYGYNLSDIYIGNLCINSATVNEHVTISQTYEMLKHNGRTQGFCVTRDGFVQGVVTRDRLNAVVGGLYGYSLYSRKSISAIMSTRFLTVDFRMPVTEAGRLAMARPDETVYDFITVTMDGRYFGVVTIKDLLNKTIEIEVTNATHLNPLTALPGNVLIEQKLRDALKLTRPGCVLYLDVDNFKAYNDVYGFENGDGLIRRLAGIITGAVAEPNFVGHVGGDDFVVLVEESGLERVDGICREILGAFEKSIPDFYRQEDLDRGYLLAKNRRGFEEQFPLLSLSIAGVRIGEKNDSDIFALAREASRIKKECKQIPGNSYLIV